MFNGQKLGRTYDINNLEAIIKSTVSQEIVLVFVNCEEKDLRFTAPHDFDDLKSYLITRRVVLNPGSTLKIFAVP